MDASAPDEMPRALRELGDCLHEAARRQLELEDERRKTQVASVILETSRHWALYYSELRRLGELRERLEGLEGDEARQAALDGLQAHIDDLVPRWVAAWDRMAVKELLELRKVKNHERKARLIGRLSDDYLERLRGAGETEVGRIVQAELGRRGL